MSNTSIEADPAKYPGFLGVGYLEAFTMPPQPKEKKTGQLPEEKGFTVVENFFTLGEIESARESFRQLVDEIAQKLYKSGRIKNLYEDYELENRLIMLEKEWPGAVSQIWETNSGIPGLIPVREAVKCPGTTSWVRNRS